MALHAALTDCLSGEASRYHAKLSRGCVADVQCRSASLRGISWKAELSRAEPSCAELSCACVWSGLGVWCWVLADGRSAVGGICSYRTFPCLARRAACADAGIYRVHGESESPSHPCIVSSWAQNMPYFWMHHCGIRFCPSIFFSFPILSRSTGCVVLWSIALPREIETRPRPNDVTGIQLKLPTG